MKNTKLGGKTVRQMNHFRQRGAVLIVSLLFLLLLTLIATTASRTSTFELKMAGNEQSRIEATQKAMAVVHAIESDSDNTPIVGNIGYKICATGVSGGGCNESIINLSSAVTTVQSGASLSYNVTRKGPLETDAPTMDEDQASSASAFKVARYEVTASYDGSGAGMGSAEIVQGVLVKIPSQAN